MYCTMFCNLECIPEANDSDSHIYILEMLSHLKTYFLALSKVKQWKLSSEGSAKVE